MRVSKGQYKGFLVVSKKTHGRESEQETVWATCLLLKRQTDMRVDMLMCMLLGGW